MSDKPPIVATAITGLNGTAKMSSDDDTPIRRRTKKRGRGTWRAIALGLLISGAIVAVFVGVAVMERATAPKVYEREELEKLVMGKTKSQAIEILGRPDWTNYAGGQEYWTYEQITYDPVAKRIDNRTAVWFEGGHVTAVDY